MAHSLPYTVNCSILFKELPLLERPAAVKAAGLDAVEFWWPFETAVPGDKEVDAFISAITDAGVQLTGLNFFDEIPRGERGLVSLPARASEFRDNIDVALGIGRALGTKAFNALYGLRVEGVSPQEQDELAAENLARAADAAEKDHAVVLLEPLSGAPAYPLKTAADVVAVMDAVDRPNLVLLADLYHLAANGDDVAAAIDTYAERAGHVQIADHPGRNEPGTGDLPVDAWLQALQSKGYDGYVGLEYNPTGSSLDSLAWLKN